MKKAFLSVKVKAHKYLYSLRYRDYFLHDFFSHFAVSNQHYFCLSDPEKGGKGGRTNDSAKKLKLLCGTKKEVEAEVEIKTHRH